MIFGLKFHLVFAFLMLFSFWNEGVSWVFAFGSLQGCLDTIVPKVKVIVIKPIHLPNFFAVLASKFNYKSTSAFLRKIFQSNSQAFLSVFPRLIIIAKTVHLYSSSFSPNFEINGLGQYFSPCTSRKTSVHVNEFDNQSSCQSFARFFSNFFHRFEGLYKKTYTL